MSVEPRVVATPAPATTAERGTPGEAPAGYRERRVAGLFREVLGVDEVGGGSDFFALGGDSRTAARLLDVIEEDAGVRLPEAALRESPTVRALARRIATAHPTRRARVVGYGTGLPGRPLFVLVPAFHARALGRAFNAVAERPMYAIQPAGLEGRAFPDRGIERRARRALADIRSVQPEGPYEIGGYSLSAFVALEVVRMLREQGERVDVLLTLDIWAPVFGPREVARLVREKQWQDVCQWHPDRGPFFDARRRAIFARNVVREARSELAWRVRGWTAGIFPRGTTLQGRLFFKLTERDVRGYLPAPVDVDAVVLRAEEFGGSDWARRRAEPDMSWRRAVRGRVEIVPIPGDHIAILEDEHAGTTAAAIARVLDRVATGQNVPLRLGSDDVTGGG